MVNSPLSDKAKQFFFVIIKIAIVVFAFYAIYAKLFSDEQFEFSEFIQLINQNRYFSTKIVLFIIFLSVLNWLLEIQKWKILVSSLIKISFKSAAKQSLGALTASLFTPNRIGEYGAKAIYFKKNERKSILAINFLGNMMQMGTTMLFGVVGLFFFKKYYRTRVLDFNPYIIIGILMILILIVLFVIKKNKLKIKGIPAHLFIFSRGPIGGALLKLEKLYTEISGKVYLKGFFISILRYLVFSFQFYFLLKHFGADLNYFNLMVIISTMYLLTSVIPSIFIFDVVIRASVAIYLFSFLEINGIIILAVVTLMWLLNFALPSILGSYFVLNFKLPK